MIVVGFRGVSVAGDDARKGRVVWGLVLCERWLAICFQPSRPLRVWSWGGQVCLSGLLNARVLLGLLLLSAARLLLFVVCHCSEVLGREVLGWAGG